MLDLALLARGAIGVGSAGDPGPAGVAPMVAAEPNGSLHLALLAAGAVGVERTRDARAGGVAVRAADGSRVFDLARLERRTVRVGPARKGLPRGAGAGLPAADGENDEDERDELLGHGVSSGTAELAATLGL
jgi:hypothetical protein